MVEILTIVLNHGQLGGQPRLMSPVTPGSAKKRTERNRREMKEKEGIDAIPTEARTAPIAASKSI
jgi:hypothetical protein